MGIRPANPLAAVCSEHTVPRQTRIARGEASRDAPLPVPGGSICEDTQVLSGGSLVCMIKRLSFC